MEEERREVVVPKEEAVFGLDARGRWQHVEQGLFENPRIIAYFHSCIRKDEMGYHLVQDHGHIREKVYFPYEDTALFVFDVLKGDPPILVLNTGERKPLQPEKLFIRGDVLYARIGEHRVRFTEDALVRISGLLEFDDEGSAFIRLGEKRTRIPGEPSVNGE